ncbi:unnamed protein product [Schistosoma turkestanicum]|nr:unnamed protein product [Schistosoma turkestanicum]
MDVFCRIVREKLGYEVLLTNDQFYSFGSALEKINMALIVAALTKNFLDELNNKQYPEKRGDNDQVNNYHKTLSRITDRIDDIESRLINIELGRFFNYDPRIYTEVSS